MFIPVELDEVQALPETYFQMYQGQISNDLIPGDWSRAGYCIVWVELSRNPNGVGYSVVRSDPYNTLYPPGGAPALPSRDMERIPRPWELPIKVELEGALRQWAPLGL